MDKFEPISGGDELGHFDEATGQLVITDCDGTVDLEVTEHSLNAVAPLLERFSNGLN